MIRWMISILALGAAVSVVSGQAWKTKSNPSVTLHYHTGDAENVAGVLEVMEAATPDFEEKLGISLGYAPQIYVTSSQAEFDRVTGGRLPPWSHGVSSARTGRIVLKSPSFARDISTFNRTALHELVHLLVAGKAGQQVPRWLNEGLAQLLSGEAQGKPLMPLSRSLWTGRLIPLGDIEQVDRFTQTDAELAYLESFHATEYFIKQYGWEMMRILLGSLGEGLTLDEALFRETETDLAGFEASWQAELKKSYRWIVLLDTQLYLFAGATLLVILGGMVMMRRRRRIYRKWEAEDGPHADVI